MPSDATLRAVLHELSVELYACIGMGGEVGPSLYEYKQHRREDMPQGHTLLAAFGLSQCRAGWAQLLNAYGFLSPTLGESKQASRRRHALRHSLPNPELDESYPELAGYWKEYVSYEYLGEGKVLRTTTRVFQVR
jgi:hypothetical protein